MRLTTFLLLLLVLVACGQKGPLFLPNDTQEEASKKVTSTNNRLLPVSIEPSTPELTAPEQLNSAKMTTLGFKAAR